MQHADGWWKGELQANVTIDAEDLLLREFLGIRTQSMTERDRHVDPRPAARRRHVGDVHRRPRRPVDDGRGVRRAAPRRRSAGSRAHGEGGGLRARRRRPGAGTGLHAHVAGPRRAVVMGPDPGAAAGADPAPASRPAEHLRLRLLGAPDDRRAHRGRRPPPDPAAPVRSRRAAHRRPTAGAAVAAHGRRQVRAARPHPPPLRAAPDALAAQDGDRSRGGVDLGPPRSRRLVGRYPAAVGVLAARAPPRGLRPRPSGDACRLRGARPVHDRGRPRTACRVLPVPGVGHGAGHDRSQRRRVGGRRSRAAEGCGVGARRGDPRARRLGGAPSGPRAERLGLRVRERQLRRYRRHGDRRPRPAAGPPSRRRGDRRGVPAGAALARRHAVRRRRVGCVRRGQHAAALHTSPVLRLRRGHRSSVGGRHGARARVPRRRAGA